MRERQPNWFAVFTKPQQEKVALENLERQGFHCFLPLAINPFQRSSRGKTRIEPLFPRYLFLRAIANQQSLAPVRSTRGVHHLVSFGKRIATLPDRAIDKITLRCHPETGLVELKPVPVEVGDTVRVFDGPLAGLEGIFSELKGERRALLLMSLLGSESMVEVDSLLLQKAM